MGSEINRKLVTIRIVSEIKPISNADNIELAIVDGWQCVVKKGEFQVGNRGIYFEIDSFIPLSKEPGNSPFEFLRKDAREWNGLFGVRIKTIKLRGQISQGLLFSPKSIPSPLPLKRGEYLDDLTGHFNVVKWEKIVEEQEVRKDSWIDPIVRFFVPKAYRKTVFELIYKSWFFSEKMKRRTSSFPKFIPKTDQERVQNILSKVLGSTEIYSVSCKMDGSSMSVWVNEGKFGFASRNCTLGVKDGSKFAEVVNRYDLPNKLPKGIKGDFAIQGELCGPGIQENYEQLDEIDFFVFDVYSISEQRYLTLGERIEFLEGLDIPLKTVPELGMASLSQFKSIDDYLAFAEGPSFKNPKREGVVFKNVHNGNDSFKVVSNSYLLRKG